ncbi:hypothetical protein PR048_022034 [Dryococelus australis]|uniref:Uncharacterized protein n=1 Tax=Dryococelus australis TaxID=614101 RepID=A0ABQ9GZV8_9NEOP|nr:hypothetical protein PR048_022034 [Dryococelus australis]
MRVIEVSIEQRRSEGEGGNGRSRGNPPTSVIVRYDSHSSAYRSLSCVFIGCYPTPGSYGIRKPFPCKSVIGSEACKVGLINCNPVTKTTRLQHRLTVFDYRLGRSRIFARGNSAGRWRCSPGILEDLPFSPPLFFGAAPYSSLFTLFQLERRMNKVMRPMAMLILHKAEEYATCIQVDLKQGYQKCSFCREQSIDRWNSRLYREPQPHTPVKWRDAARQLEPRNPLATAGSPASTVVVERFGRLLVARS